VDALIILAILIVSGILGFWQEYVASQATAKLLAMVQIKATVRRQGLPANIPVEEIVPGDVILLNAGDVIIDEGLISQAGYRSGCGRDAAPKSAFRRV
jgi:P-type Mg2+ transporter